MQPQKGYFQRLRPDGGLIGTRFPVMYNPTDFSLTKGSQLAEVPVPGLDSPLQQFVRGQAEKLTVKLFFDVTDEGMGRLAPSVTEKTDRFYSFVKINSDEHAPPICKFTWGSKFPGSDLPDEESQRRDFFTGVVESLQQEFTMFSSAGLPLRANLTVTLREYKTLVQQLKQLHLMSTDRTTRYVARRGETLASIAAASYGNAAMWRPIADANGLENPRALAAGTVLRIPAVERGGSR